MVRTPRINILSASSDRDGLLYVGGTLLSTARFASNATFKVGVRPQSAYLAPVGSDRSLAVRILRREDLGGDIYLYLELAATGEAFAVRVERRTADGARDGAHAAVVIDGDHLHVFDDAGRRVSSRLTGLLGSKSAHA
jgi:ABC-type Fe3+/spermidine/putrescine transport system ATPase subunit